ncbi:MAG: hypothetical protein LBJ97_02455 [Mycoplasmataceae bacterium]|nr:hypothetical protein [Mycoplasmataceae bacterium]
MGNNFLNAKNKPHALLLIESKLCDLNNFVKNYMKSIVSSVGSKEWSQKIDDNTYYDIIRVNGYENTIKKDDILNIVNQFSKTSVESLGIKFYIIYGIEFATSQAVNSLLKFLEEPPVDTYAILTTRALNLVLPTIKSRCQTFILKSDLNIFTETFKSIKLNEQQLKTIKNIYYSYDEAIKDINNNDFYDSYELALSFVKNFDNLAIIKQLQEKFIKLDYKQIMLILKIINTLIPTNPNIIKILENISVNPIKILLFNNVWSILRGVK